MLERPSVAGQVNVAGESAVVWESDAADERFAPLADGFGRYHQNPPAGHDLDSPERGWLKANARFAAACGQGYVLRTAR